VDKILKLDENCRTSTFNVDENKKEMKILSKQIGEIMKKTNTRKA